MEQQQSFHFVVVVQKLLDFVVMAGMWKLDTKILNCSRVHSSLTQGPVSPHS